MKDYSGYINRRTTKCPRCSGELKINEIIKTPLLGVTQVIGEGISNFYGGNVKRFSPTKCPSCKASILLYLKNVGVGWKIHDVAIEEGVLTADYKTVDNKNGTKGAKGEQNAATEEREASTDDIVTILDVDTSQRNDLYKAIVSTDLEAALEALDTLDYGFVPKTLIEAGFDHELVYTKNGKQRKKDYYVDLIKDTLNEANSLREAEEKSAIEKASKQAEIEADDEADEE